MFEYDRINISEGIDFNETNESRKCIIWKDHYFVKVNFRFQPEVFDDCHDLMQKGCKF